MSAKKIVTQPAAKTAGTNAGKDVIYIDVDDEITGIIDKVRGSSQKIVALVLPKRATVLQSVVNMKLLKRSSEEVKKNIVLITTEAGLIPLAGSVGMHVAKSLQTKPEVPDQPGAGDEPEVVDELQDDGLDDEPVDKAKSVGELATGSSLADDLEETIEMGDEEADDETAEGAEAGKDAGTSAKNKKLKIPNFNKFRMLLLLGIPVLIVLIVGIYVCLAVLPKASVDIKTDSQAINSSAVLTLKTDPNTKVDVASSTLPATQQSSTKTLTQQVPTTGQQNNGAKATGSVSMSAGACSANAPADVPAGSALSGSSLTFITQTNTTFGAVIAHGKCTYQATQATTVQAQTGGTQYNIAASSFTVAGRADIAASGSAMTGGTDDITKIVTKADIDSATQKLGAQDTTAVKQELQTGLTTKNLLPIEETFNSGSPQNKTSNNVGEAADNLTVTQTVTYTMLGVQQSDLQKIVTADVDKKIDPKKQSILNYGLTEAVFGLQTQNPDGANVTMQTTVVAGSVLNTADIKTQIAGKKAADAKSLIKQNPGVTDVNVSYSPFWVSSIPGKTSKITVIVEKPKAPTRASNASTHP